MKTKYLLMVGFTVIFTVFSACSGKDGAEGPEGPQGPEGPLGPEGPQGPGGAESLVDQEALSTGDATCPDGGVIVKTGLDGNENGILDPDEVTDQEWICDGPQGTPGSNDLVVTDDAITVGATGDFATLPEALDSLAGKIIPPDMMVTIAVEDATYMFNSSLVINHPYGDRIEIIGNQTNPEQVVFDFGPNDGIVVENGNAIGLIDGVTIQGDGTAGRSGVHASNNATIKLGANVVVQDFGHSGVKASAGGVVWANGVTSRDNGRYGFLATENGTIHAMASLAQNNSDGYIATINSTIIATNSTASGNTNRGFLSVGGSYIYANGCTSTGNDDGFHAAYASNMIARGSVASGNSSYGFVVWQSSYLDARGLDASNHTIVCDNASGSFLPAPNAEGQANSWIETDANLTDTGTGACP
jgi:hypothetical protein